MIAKLTVTRFGKFASRTFPLGPVTFFSGGNEAGKTALFDALFEALCKPSGAKTHGKRLKSRYGDERRAEVSPADTGFSPDPNEFANLHAIRSGDTWRCRLRARSQVDRQDQGVSFFRGSGSQAHTG